MSAAPNEAEHALARALEIEDYEAASRLAQALLERDPAHRDAAYARGMAAWSKKLHGVAKPWLRAGSAGNPTRRVRYFKFLYERGDLLELSSELRLTGGGTEDDETRRLRILTGARLGNAFLQVYGYREALDIYRQTVEDIGDAVLATPLGENIGQGLLASCDGCRQLPSLFASADRAVRDLQGPHVVGGIFEGLVLPDPFGYAVAAFRIGSYEAECAPVLSAAVNERRYQRVVNIGCAWGYYAVGLARLLTQASVIGFESDPVARGWAERVAAANGVADRVSLLGTCTHDGLQTALEPTERGLLVVDCEGGELTLLEGDTVRILAHWDLLVECHDFIDPAITTRLIERFAASHQVEKIAKTFKAPSDYPRLRSIRPLDRWFAVLEARAERTHWLWLRSTSTVCR